MIPRRGYLIPVLVACFLFALGARGHSQDGHTHEGAVGKFYQTWMMPDNRGIM